MVEVFQNGIGDLEDVLQQRHAPPEMWQAMRKDILSFRTGEHSPHTDNTHMTLAMEDQQRIGWDDFLKGRVIFEMGRFFE